jgi:hypothetical protein
MLQVMYLVSIPAFREGWLWKDPIRSGVLTVTRIFMQGQNIIFIDLSIEGVPPRLPIGGDRATATT